MKMRWALMSALGLMAPVAVVTPMLATSCGNSSGTKKTEVAAPTAKTGEIGVLHIFGQDVTINKFTDLKTYVESLDHFDKVMEKLFDNGTAKLMKDNVDSITAAEKTTTEADPTNVTITIKLKSDYVFKNSTTNDNSGSQTKAYNLQVSYAK